MKQQQKPCWIILRDGKIFGARMSRTYACELSSYFASRKENRKHTSKIVRGIIVVARR